MPVGWRTALLVILDLGYAWLLVSLAVASSLPAAARAFPDDLAHALAYGAETFLLYWILRPLVRPLTVIAAAWIGTAVLGSLTEILQELQGTRSADPADLLADMIGASTVIVVTTGVRGAMSLMRGITG